MKINPVQEITNFSFSELQRYLKFLKTVAPVVPMREYMKCESCIILRQDVDLDFHASYDVYKLQKRIGISSTFFVLLTSPTYNPQSMQIRKKLREMTDDGFEIGLHFDPTVYGRANLQEMVEKEAQLLESITGEEVKSVTLHNPSISGQYPRFKGFINGYQEDIFEDARYLSDSMRVDAQRHPFRGKDPYEFVKKAKKFPLQIVLHPEQFMADGGDFVDTIVRYSARATADAFHDYEKGLAVIRGKKS